MDGSEETMDLTEYFYAAGRNAAKRMEIEDDDHRLMRGTPSCRNGDWAARNRRRTPRPPRSPTTVQGPSPRQPERDPSIRGGAICKTPSKKTSSSERRVPKTPIPQPPPSSDLPEAVGTSLSERVSERSNDDEQAVWSRLKECLVLFADTRVTTDLRDVHQLLGMRLNEALKAVTAEHVGRPSVDVPFDGLIEACGSDCGQAAAIEVASSILTGNALRAWCFSADREEGTLVVRCEDVEERLLASGEYARRSLKASGEGSEVTLTCIRMKDAVHFWAYVGSEWPKRLEELDAVYEACDVSDDELEGDDGGEMYLTERPNNDDVLMLAAQDAPDDDFGVSAVRVRVVDVQRDKALLWCLDLATYSIQEWRRLRRCHKKMSKIPYQAKLCRIEGLFAKPSFEIVLKCCALLLTLLTRWTFTLDDDTLTNFFNVFPPLCYGPWKALHRTALSCVCVGATLAGVERKSSLPFHRLLDEYVECIRETSSGDSIYEDSEEELMTSTQAVRNLLYSFGELRKYFAKLGGFPVLTQLLHSGNLGADLEMEIWKLLRVLFGAGDLSKEGATMDCPARANHEVGPNDAVPEGPHQKPPARILPRKSIKNLLKDWMLASLEQKTTEESVVGAEGPALPIGCTASSHHDANREYLIRGKVFPLLPGDAVIVMPQRKLNEIVGVSSVRAVCGLLNSDAGGTIYFGIGPRNVVEGINVLRKQRDVVRCGFDTLFDQHLSPRISPSACRLTYVKVFERNEPKELDRAQHTLHVIRLDIKVSPGTLYKMKSGQYYVIKDGGAVEARTQELRERIVRVAEKQFT